MTDINRLREILRTSTAARPRQELTYVPVDVPEGPDSPADRAACLGATSIDSAQGTCLVIDRVYEPSMAFGDVRVGDGDVSGEAALAWLAGSATASATGQSSSKPASPALERVAFVDIETTGLSGGAGMCAFLVGCARFEDGVFRCRQFFLPTFAHERGLLTAVAEHLDDVDVLVTYNGKTFDLPVMETR